MESNYGKILANKGVMRDTIRSLATLAYADQKRAKYAYTQLIAAMKILQRGEITRAQLIGSWAGAMGHTQFIPSSYLTYAIDMDGDGRCDIWTSVPDALATAANLLHMNGWKPNLLWGVEVKLPKEKNLPEDWHSFEEWAKLGVKQANGQPLPSSSEQAILKYPDGPQGPIFLVTKISLFLNDTIMQIAMLLLLPFSQTVLLDILNWFKIGNAPFRPLLSMSVKNCNLA